MLLLRLREGAGETDGLLTKTALGSLRAMPASLLVLSEEGERLDSRWIDHLDLCSDLRICWRYRRYIEAKRLEPLWQLFLVVFHFDVSTLLLLLP